jgi:hypothetical protein
MNPAADRIGILFGDITLADTLEFLAGNALPERVVFVLYTEQDAALYRSALARMGGST